MYVGDSVNFARDFQEGAWPVSGCQSKNPWIKVDVFRCSISLFQMTNHLFTLVSRGCITPFKRPVQNGDHPSAAQRDQRHVKALKYLPFLHCGHHYKDRSPVLSGLCSVESSTLTRQSGSLTHCITPRPSVTILGKYPVSRTVYGKDAPASSWSFTKVGLDIEIKLVKLLQQEQRLISG